MSTQLNWGVLSLSTLELTGWLEAACAGPALGWGACSAAVTPRWASRSGGLAGGPG